LKAIDERVAVVGNQHERQDRDLQTTQQGWTRRQVTVAGTEQRVAQQHKPDRHRAKTEERTLYLTVVSAAEEPLHETSAGGLSRWIGQEAKAPMRVDRAMGSKLRRRQTSKDGRLGQARSHELHAAQAKETLQAGLNRQAHECDVPRVRLGLHLLAVEQLKVRHHVQRCACTNTND
jgi:hypothetical protein